MEKEIGFVITRCVGCGERELNESSQKVLTSSYKKKSIRDVICNMINIISLLYIVDESH